MVAGKNKADKLPLEKGMTLEIIVYENRVAFIGRIKSVKKGIVQLENAVSENLPPIVFNTYVKFRGFLPGMKPIVGRGKICGSGDRYWWLDDIEVKQIIENRAFFRQSISVPAKVTRLSTLMDDMNTSNVKLVDISCGGIGFKSTSSFRIDEVIMVSDLKLDTDEPFNLICTVRRMAPKGNEYIYGCEFREINQRDEQRLMKAIFKIQRSSLQRR